MKGNGEATIHAMLPYGPPVDWDDLSVDQRAEVLRHQLATVRWKQRVRDKGLK